MTAPPRPGETEAERDDRNLAELLRELRVAGLGVQVIFAFLRGEGRARVPWLRLALT